MVVYSDMLARFVPSVSPLLGLLLCGALTTCILNYEGLTDEASGRSGGGSSGGVGDASSDFVDPGQGGFGGETDSGSGGYAGDDPGSGGSGGSVPPDAGTGGAAPDTGPTCSDPVPSVANVSPYAHWPLDGDAADTQDKYDGTPTLVSFTDSCTGLNGAALFDNPQALLTAPSASVPGDPVTVALWIRPLVDQDSVLLTKFPPSGARNGWALLLTAKREISVRVANGTIVTNSLRTGAYTPQEWSHFAFTVSGGIVKSYIDGGREYGGDTSIGHLEDNIAMLRMGGGSAPTATSVVDSNPYRGNIDEVRVYRSVLDAGQIRVLAKAKPR